jgi:WD40 repeat protein
MTTLGAILLTSVAVPSAEPAGPAKAAPSATILLPSGGVSGAFSPDNKVFASGGQDGSITLWDTTTGKRLHTLRQQEGGRVVFVTFATDGKLLESRTMQGEAKGGHLTIRLWDASTGKEAFRLATLAGWDGRPEQWEAAFSPDHRTLATITEERAIRLVDVATGKELRKLTWPAGTFFRYLAFSPNGETVAAHDSDTVCLWDPSTGQELRRRTWPGQVASIAFKADGGLLVTNYPKEDWRVVARLWDMAARKPLLESEVLLSGTISSDGKSLIAFTGYSPCGVGGALLWDVRTAKGGPLFHGEIHPDIASAFSPDSRVLAACWGVKGRQEDAVQLWEAPAGKPLVRVALPGGVSSMTFSPDGKTLAVLGSRRCALVRTADFRGFGGRVSALALSPDGKLVAVGEVDGTVDVRDLAGGKLVHQLGRHEKTVEAITFSPDGKTLATTSEDREVRMWDPIARRLRHRVSFFSTRDDKGAIVVFAFSRDARRLHLKRSLMGHEWDVATGEEIDRVRPIKP